MNVVTRFAPSPTWYVHIWSLRTVLYNVLFAKKNKGTFMLRVEDTDQSRYVEGSIENMLKVLGSVWLKPDLWPDNPWDKWPFFQSQRLEIYKKYVDQLIKEDKAYYCFCSSERLEKLREEQKSLQLPTKYDGKCRYLSQEEIDEKLASWCKYTVRLKVPKEQTVVFSDVIKWKVTVHTKDIDDQVLLKSDGFPTYHLANVIDDHLMWVTHVIRWDEWTPSTPKHVLIYDAFGWDYPIFAHIPLLLWSDKKKLSKRTGDVSVESYLEQWYLTEALINYIALLGWNPKTTEEFFTFDELIERFDLNQVHKAWAVFDQERLDFFNSNYMKKADISYLYQTFISYLSTYDKEFLAQIETFSEEYNKKILNEIRTKIKKFSEFKNATKFFYEENLSYDHDLFLNEKMKIENLEWVKTVLQLSKNIIENVSDFDSLDDVKDVFIEAIKENGFKNGQVLWPLRVALTGEKFSPGALEMIYILWNRKSRERIEKVLKEI